MTQIEKSAEHQPDAEVAYGKPVPFLRRDLPDFTFSPVQEIQLPYLKKAHRDTGKWPLFQMNYEPHGLHGC